MKIEIAAALAALVVLSSPVRAGEITLKLDDNAQNAVGQLPGLLDQCVAGVTMRADASVCRSVSTFLTAMVNEVKTTQAASEKAAADEAAKKTADKPAKAKDKPAP